MTTYRELKDRHSKEVNEFTTAYCAWAFGNKQYKELLEKLNLTEKELQEKYAGFIGGGIILKDKINDWKELSERHYNEMHDAMLNNEEFAKSAFLYEMGNFEVFYSSRYNEVFGALGVTQKDLETNPALANAFRNAKREYWDWCIENC